MWKEKQGNHDKQRKLFWATLFNLIQGLQNANIQFILQNTSFRSMHDSLSYLSLFQSYCNLDITFVLSLDAQLRLTDEFNH